MVPAGVSVILYFTVISFRANLKSPIDNLNQAYFCYDVMKTDHLECEHLLHKDYIAVVKI